MSEQDKQPNPAPPAELWMIARYSGDSRIQELAVVFRTESEARHHITTKRLGDDWRPVRVLPCPECERRARPANKSAGLIEAVGQIRDRLIGVLRDEPASIRDAATIRDALVELCGVVVAIADELVTFNHANAMLAERQRRAGK